MSRPTPVISVIVPFYGVEEYVADCLDSLLAQELEDFEAILVDDGSRDGSRAIAEDYARRDPRLRVVTRPNGGLGAARNTGIREARGEFLTFVDSDDIVPPSALRVLHSSATATGSDLVAGAVERFTSQRTWTPQWADDAHAVRRERIVIDQAIPLLRNLYTWDKLFRSDFWHAQGLWFREGVAYEDQPIVTQLLARATAIDVLPDIVYRYRMRDDRSSISQQTASLRDLRDRIEAWRTSREVLRVELSPQAYQGWLQTLFEAHFQWYLASPGADDDTYWSELREAVVGLAAEADDRVWDATPPHQRVMVRLAQLGRREDIRELVRREGSRLDRWPARVREDGILLELPFLGDPDLDESLFLLRPAQVRAVHAVDHLRWGAGPEPTLHLSGWAYLRKVDLRAHRGQVVVELRDTAGTEVVTTAAAPDDGATSAVPQEDQGCDYSAGRFAAEVPLGALVAGARAGTDGTPWEVWLRVEAAGLVAEVPVTRTARSAVVSVPGALPVGDGDRVTVGWGHHLPLELRVERGAA